MTNTNSNAPVQQGEHQHLQSQPNTQLWQQEQEQEHLVPMPGYTPQMTLSRLLSTSVLVADAADRARNGNEDNGNVQYYGNQLMMEYVQNPMNPVDWFQLHPPPPFDQGIMRHIVRDAIAEVQALEAEFFDEFEDDAPSDLDLAAVANEELREASAALEHFLQEQGLPQDHYQQ